MTQAPEHGLDQVPVTRLKGAGPRVADRLERLGIRNVQDLLFHLPLRYEDRTRVTPIGTLRPGDQRVIEGRIGLSQIKFGRRRSLLCQVSDGTGSLLLRFFHFSAAQQARLEQGALIRCYGEARRGPAALEMVHPEYQLCEVQATALVEETLTPVYPTTEGLHQLSLRRLTDGALALLDAYAASELLPEDLRRRLRFPALAEAIRLVHRPPPETRLRDMQAGLHPAQQRLAFEELLAHHLSLRLVRARAQHEAAPAIAGDGALANPFRESLPFALTAAQQRVDAQIAADMALAQPMQRLLQGDVGSGKTVVAALAALRVIEAGFQFAVMAPTEILAEQHWNTFRAWCEPHGIEPVWLAGKLGAGPRRGALGRLSRGEAQLAVGTHALFQADVDFARLGLVIVDEQHRFGVDQRLALREKGRHGGMYPHQLIMTATPIPRTLAMTAYADLDTSIIDELPPGRTPVETVVIPDSRRDEVVERIQAACGEGRQAYWVCTLIDESETLQAQAASDTAALLAEALPQLRVGLVHGRMKPVQKEAVMNGFKEAAIDLLVATTVIEVGVDVPAASLMVIENAERLGLAQLHQLRGRVGRGAARSSCVLMYHGPLTRHARERLHVLRETNDGFEIARKDLELRGPGEVLGTRQTGMPQLRIADLVRDARLFPAIEASARELLRDYPGRVRPLVHRWLGNAVDYGNV